MYWDGQVRFRCFQNEAHGGQIRKIRNSEEKNSLKGNYNTDTKNVTVLFLFCAFGIMEPNAHNESRPAEFSRGFFLELHTFMRLPYLARCFLNVARSDT